MHHSQIFNPKLRYGVPSDLDRLNSTALTQVHRRAKYLLLEFAEHTLLCHLGMSGSFVICPASAAIGKHQHLRFNFGELDLRYNDPRRFGSVQWHNGKLQQRLDNLGPEPLTEAFSAHYLQAALARKGSAIKGAIMDQAIVVGVGNIYATEALFMAGIHPNTAANRIALSDLAALVGHIKHILQAAINLGGSTLNDYVNGQGQTGYFQQTLLVYGRSKQPCPVCTTPIQAVTIAGRTSSFCPQCQPLLTLE